MSECFALRLEHPEWKHWRPGQFVMVRHPSFGLELIWGRAFSISRLAPSGLSLFIQAWGRGTRRLADSLPGDTVTVWGPLGNGFAVQDKRTLMLAGGVGLAPFLAYAEAHPTPKKLELIFGHRLPLETYPFENVRSLVPDMTARSFHEQTPEDLPKFLDLVDEAVERHANGGLILACGPTPFLRAVKKMAAEHGAMAQVSLENKMGCGVGACLGCVAKDDKGEPVQVCSKGPVFWAHKIEL
ncbi:MAG: dihydroorotate dehydrogenase electron transfer subunit [Oceanidesulfovibrio sp.]